MPSRSHFASDADNLKPPLPYVAGCRLDIKRHTPPEPIGGGYKRPQRRRHPEYKELQEYKTASSLCLACPPLETPPHPDGTVHHMAITGQIACGDSRGPQLVTCRLDSDSKTKLRVAKIFDPLYYDYEHRDCDVTYLADRHYAAESASYQKLRDAGVEGKFTPRYNGSWTFETPLLDGRRRAVRMVLMDQVSCPSMLSLIENGVAAGIPPDRRMRALAQALEAHRWLEFYGVQHADFMPRNIMVNIGRDTRQSPVQVTIIDFGDAYVRDLPNSKWVTVPEYRKARPASPMNLFRFYRWNAFKSWVPEQLHSRRALVEWLRGQWGGSTVFEPPEREPTSEEDEDKIEVESDSDDI